MQEQMTIKQRSALLSYPMAVFFFVVLVVGMSIFASETVSDEESLQYEREQLNIDNPKVQKQLSEILSNQNDTLVHATYQPIKKEDFLELSLPNAHSAVILDVDSGTILFEKEATEHRSIASITKLVTAMLVIDRVRDLNEVVVVPKEVIGIEGTKVGCPTSVICTSNRLQVGEKVRVLDLLRAMLMFSANDAATILGLHIGGTEEGFAKLMNARMKEIGAGNTHFCRPSGLELDENEQMCYSSAYDIARVGAHLLQYEKYDILWEIMRTKEATFTSVDGTIEHELKNTDRLLDKMPNLIGAKTGFTPRAGYSLLLAAHDGTKKHKIVSVVLDDYHRFNDVEEMTAWAFENYKWQ